MRGHPPATHAGKKADRFPVKPDSGQAPRRRLLGHAQRVPGFPPTCRQSQRAKADAPLCKRRNPFLKVERTTEPQTNSAKKLSGGISFKTACRATRRFMGIPGLSILAR